MCLYTLAGRTLKQTSVDLPSFLPLSLFFFALRLQKPAGPLGADRHTALFQRPPNAFLSASICGWSAPLESLPFICRFQRQRSHKQTKTLEPVLADAPQIEAQKITLRKSEQQSCCHDRDMAARVLIDVCVYLLAFVSNGEMGLIHLRLQSHKGPWGGRLARLNDGVCGDPSFQVGVITQGITSRRPPGGYRQDCAHRPARNWSLGLRKATQTNAWRMWRKIQNAVWPAAHLLPLKWCRSWPHESEECVNGGFNC